MPTSADWGRVGGLTLRWLASFLVTYFFLVVLMTAAAQQRVTAVLDKGDSQISYSSALARVKAVEQTKAELAKLRGQEAAQRQSEQAKLNEVHTAEAQLEEIWGQVAPVARRAAALQDCNLPPMPIDRPEDRLAAWVSLTDCAQNQASFPPGLKRQVEQLTEKDPNFQVAYSRLQSLRRDVGGLGGDIARTQDEVKAKAEAAAKAEALSDTFDDMNVLRRSWWTLGPLAVEFPPTLLQIVLAFASGVFGALLVTLVLVVYPKVEFTAAAEQEFGSRLLLGGLISLGSYVILGGGSAVLGNTDPFGEHQANFMSFSAVGVLAGMFSDRVAAWMSEKANLFFAEKAAEPGT